MVPFEEICRECEQGATVGQKGEFTLATPGMAAILFSVSVMMARLAGSVTEPDVLWKTT
jgi:hypothetical protein